MPVDITESNYQEVTESDGLNVVQFTASWCVPCRHLTPRLTELEEDGAINYFKVDVDDNPELTREFNIMSVPTLVIYRDGRRVNTVVGVKSKPEILKVLEES